MRRSSALAILVAVSVAACGSSGPSLTAFKSSFKTDKAQFRQLGLDMDRAIGNARSKTDTQLATELSALSTRAHQQAANLARLKAPSKYQQSLGRLVAGFNAIATDLQRISVAAKKNDAEGAGRATRALVADAGRVKAADVAITAQLGLAG